MSRIGTQPIPIPSGVEVSIAGDNVTVKGKLGTLVQPISAGIKVAKEENSLVVSRENDLKQTRACHGLMRSLLNNHVLGVSEGYKKELEIHGVSYQASASPKAVTLKVGFANEITIAIPQGVTVELPNPTRIVVTGPDKQKVGQFAAVVRSARPPEPYKGKGIRYRDERIQRKQGKSFVGSE
jgi:large subunit ribosomal protein L6